MLSPNPSHTLIRIGHVSDASAEDSSPTDDVFRTRVFSTTKKAWPMSPEEESGYC
jgi:hypothetical protein